MRLIPTSSGKLYAASKKDIDILIEKPSRFIFDVIWNLAEELKDRVAAETKYAKRVLIGNIPDYKIPPSRKQFAAQLNEVHKTLGYGKVLVHCWGGHGRTGMAVACILKELDHDLPTQEALKIARAYCRGPETIEQIRFVEEYYK